MTEHFTRKQPAWRRQYRLVVQGQTRQHVYPKPTWVKARKALADHYAHQAVLTAIGHPTAEAWIEERDYTPWLRVELAEGAEL